MISFTCSLPGVLAMRSGIMNGTGAPIFARLSSTSP